jgi:phosphohistidine phosphatase SixA
MLRLSWNASPMGPPAITHRRRPFLAPVWIILLGVLAVIGVALALHASATNTIVVIVPPASRVLGSIDDPPLSEAGEQQAQALARQFGEPNAPDGLAAIYVSSTRGAKQTAAPLAQALGQQPVALGSSDPDAIAGQIMSERAGNNVLVVCPEGSVAGLIQVLSGQQIKMTQEPGVAWVVTVPSFGPASVLRVAY